jgi:hypothetical protein
MLFGQIFYKFVGLVLGINHQWPSSGLVNNNTVFCGIIIFGQFSNVPSLNFYWLSQELTH